MPFARHWIFAALAEGGYAIDAQTQQEGEPK